MLINRLSAVSAACAVAAIIGGLGPWASVQSIFGTITLDGSVGDGQIVAVVGGIGAVLLAIRAFAESGALGVMGMVAHLINAVIGIWKWVDFQELAQGQDTEFAVLSMRWGIPLIVVASILGIVAEIASLADVGKAQANRHYATASDSTLPATYWSRVTSPVAEPIRRPSASYPSVTSGRSITIGPRIGAPGTEVVLRVRGFGWNDQLRVWWYDERGRSHILPSTITVNNGTIEAPFAVPAWESTGVRRVELKAPDGRYISTNFILHEESSPEEEPAVPSSQLLTDRDSQLAVRVYPACGPINTELAVQAAGFYFDDEPRIYWIDASGQSHASRSRAVSTRIGFVGRLAVPSWETPGTREVRLRTDDGRFASARFEVTASTVPEEGTTTFRTTNQT
jgi:hypothetical protein